MNARGDDTMRHLASVVMVVVGGCGGTTVVEPGGSGGGSASSTSAGGDQGIGGAGGSMTGAGAADGAGFVTEQMPNDPGIVLMRVFTHQQASCAMPLAEPPDSECDWFDIVIRLPIDTPAAGMTFPKEAENATSAIFVSPGVGNGCDFSAFGGPLAGELTILEVQDDAVRIQLAAEFDTVANLVSGEMITVSGSYRLERCNP